MPDQVAVAANQVFALRTYMSATVPYSEIWRSTDSGESWTNYSVGLPKTSRVSSLASDGNRLYAAYYGGQVWKNTPEPVAIRPVVPSLRQLPRRLDPREGFTIPSHPGRSRYSHIGRRLPAKQGRAQPSQ
jgi:hypothetical protein